MTTSVLALTLCLIGGGSSSGESSDESVRILSHAQLSAELASLASGHPDRVQLEVIGASRSGNAIEVVRISGQGNMTARPAILLVAGLEGPRVFESSLALSHARKLAEGYSQDAQIRALLDSTTIYILPRANPDPGEGRFESPQIERSAWGRAVDNDRDGRSGEDQPQDVNGDGIVSWMRVLDPEGEWISDPADSRVMIEADAAKGERGLWKLYREGRDNDGDGSVSEDPTSDTILNRTFPAGWDELAPDAGLFPGDEPETTALLKFVHSHRDLALVLCYDGIDNLVKQPKAVADSAPSVKRIPPSGWLQSDADLLTEIGSRYKEHVTAGVASETDDAGSFQRWCYEHRGLWTLGVRLWDLPDAPPKKTEEEEEAEPSESSEPSEEADVADEAKADQAAGADAKKDPEPSSDAKHLLWIDASEGEGWRFQDWTAFEHPDLGPVEIGGFAPFARFDPPAALGLDLIEQQFSFFLTLGELLPRVQLVEFKAEALGEGLWQIDANLESGSALLPLRSKSAERARMVRPARVRFELPEGAVMVAGQSQQLVQELKGAGKRHELQWLVSGPSGMQVGISIDTDNAGALRQNLELN